MPAIRFGSFTLYGYSLVVPGTLTDGALISPPDPTSYYLTNTGTVFPTVMPCQYNYSGPTKLDTTGDGTGRNATDLPVGFVLLHGSTGPNPMLIPYHGNIGSIGGNNEGTWSMGGKTGMNMQRNSAGLNTAQDDPLVTWSALQILPAFHVTRLDTLIQLPVWGKSGTPSLPPATPGAGSAAGPSITGAYAIVWWWWKIPATDECGERHDPQFQFAAEQPPDAADGGVYEKLDPDDWDAAPTPTIAYLDPSHGRSGTPVAIVGAGFGIGAAVTFGGVAATGIVVVNATRIECVAPVHAPGAADVVVTNADGTAST